MVLHNINGLYVCGEGSVSAQAQKVQACWLLAVSLPCEHFLSLQPRSSRSLSQLVLCCQFGM